VAEVVVLLEALHPEAEAFLEARYRVRRGLDAELRGAAAIVTRGLGRVDRDVLDAAGRGLRCVARVGVGCEHLDVGEATARGLPVFYTPDAFTDATAEHALALLLALARRLVPLDRAVRTGAWSAAREGPLGVDLAGRRLGVVGLGRTGCRFAALGRALGMEVVGWSRTARPAEPPWCPLDELLATSDVVSLHLTLGPETRGFLDADRIRRMKPGALLVNVARGALVDERALAEALEEGRLRGAALDVLAEEPPPPGHPLLGRPDVLLTPHTAALTEQAFRRASLEAVRAVDDWLSGRLPALAFWRNPELGARAALSLAP
jgi:D-3-phosphoglycerate dehydrogenase